MVTEITNGIKVSVETFFQAGHSSIANSHYVFAYRITISNEGPNSIQVLRRHWNIIDSTQEKREVDGEGVVGEKPIIEAGSSYQYVSACDLRTEIGKMNGTYLIEDQLTGRQFEVKIPEFKMSVPYILN